jgi:hypothetical protein
MRKDALSELCFSIHLRDLHDRLALNPHTTREIRLRKHSNLVEFLASCAIDCGSLQPKASLI